MRPAGRTVEQELARIAAGSHGIVTRAELLGAGVSEGAIKRRVSKGTLLTEYKGVYRVGHRAPSLEARYLAAVRACGDGALLCGRAAAYLYGILKRPVPPPEVVAHTERRIEGVKTRRCRHMDRRDASGHRHHYRAADARGHRSGSRHRRADPRLSRGRRPVPHDSAASGGRPRPSAS
ncbi:MAG: type IV toxin-antitoxin system AbiEi family antitoxin domain-containing protein [Actinobacteria bacterium]|nr:MAG: type IV toxin-antitoxin system AbiEi family antitoxin domain-containing protein [Actinomycetota bacterium]